VIVRQVIEAACMAHVRRKFFDAHESTNSPLARNALGRIADHPVNRVAELLPWNITGIRPRLDQRLAA
jgi:Transposase IS66 family